jgi:hypothetical protein
VSRWAGCCNVSRLSKVNSLAKLKLRLACGRQAEKQVRAVYPLRPALGSALESIRAFVRLTESKV